MKLWIVSQSVNNDYDTFDSAVVAAETEADAAKIEVGSVPDTRNYYGTWAAPEHVKVEHIGTAKRGTKAGVVLSSFNAG